MRVTADIDVCAATSTQRAGALHGVSHIGFPSITYVGPFVDGHAASLLEQLRSTGGRMQVLSNSCDSCPITPYL
jgi:hypothetical protein